MISRMLATSNMSGNFLTHVHAVRLQRPLRHREGGKAYERYTDACPSQRICGYETYDDSYGRQWQTSKPGRSFVIMSGMILECLPERLRVHAGLLREPRRKTS